MITAMPTFIYDADFGFCTRSATWLHSEDAFELQAGQLVDDLAAIGLTDQDVSDAAHWIVDGKVSASGADAVAAALVSRGGVRKALGRVIVSKPIHPIARSIYGVVARNRYRMPGGTSACKVPR
jgi:predicted DCC family thiol-disulfide oxidoreductase YuxK